MNRPAFLSRVSIAVVALCAVCHAGFEYLGTAPAFIKLDRDRAGEIRGGGCYWTTSQNCVTGAPDCQGQTYDSFYGCPNGNYQKNPFYVITISNLNAGAVSEADYGDIYCYMVYKCTPETFGGQTLCFQGAFDHDSQLHHQRYEDGDPCGAGS